MNKIMIIDTQGPTSLSEKYKALLPQCSFRGYELAPTAGTYCHPHGMMCGYLAGVIQLEPTEIIFVRIFDEHAAMIPGCLDWLLTVIAVEKPNVISRSWGQWDQDSQSITAAATAAWKEWTEKYVALQAQFGFVDFAAAGNDDGNDADWDIDFPQCLMPETCNIIGSCRRDGVPSEFSGDGPGLQCLAWAEKIYLCNNGHFELGSGTSFAAPKMAGLCCACGHDTELWRLHVATWAEKPEGYEEATHPKFGQGCMESSYQARLQYIPKEHRPPEVRLTGALRAAERWHDYHMII